jgi:MYXO-CTERM domain-containing protein
VLTILSNARTQTIVLEGRGFIGPTAFVLQGAEQARSGTLLDFTTQRVPPPPGAPYLPQRLTLRNGGTQGNLDVLLPSADAVAGFRIERTGACGVVAPFGNGTTGPQCDIAVSFTPTELRSYAGSFFDIRTRAEGSAGEYTVFRVNLAGVGSDTAPALTWETTDGRTLSSFGDFAKDASLGCTAPGAVCERRAVLRNGGPGSVRVDFVNVIGQDSGSWSARLNPPCAAGAFVPVRGSCDVVITFTPTTAGTKSAVLQLVSTGNGPEALRLDGSYSAPAQSPELLVVQAAAFENTRAGSRSGPVEFAVTNPGDHPIDVRGWTVTGPFSVVSTTCPAFPFVLQGHNSCTVTLTFDPANSGAATGTFDVLSSMPSPTTATLLATADAAADLSSGGCSIAEGETPADPTLGMLTFLALVALWYRREARRRDQPVVRDRRLRR